MRCSAMGTKLRKRKKKKLEDREKAFREKVWKAYCREWGNSKGIKLFPGVGLQSGTCFLDWASTGRGIPGGFTKRNIKNMAKDW